MSDIDDLIAAAPTPIPWVDASEADLVASFLGHVIRGAYTSTGEFLITLSIPAEILDPHALMRSIGSMTYWQGYKV